MDRFTTNQEPEDTEDSKEWEEEIQAAKEEATREKQQDA
jgi:outer membrane murein-binding lipoprotein Lpp